MYQSSELLLTNDGRIYHLNLKPEEVATNIILVGDPGRVSLVSGFFEEIEVEKINREFVTVTGWYNNTRITVMSTGIGIGNIDIALNELDALVNIDFLRREKKDINTSLNLFRIGTSGAIQPEIEAGSYIVSRTAIGLDGLLNFQEGKNEICDTGLEEELLRQIPLLGKMIYPYAVDSSEILTNQLIAENVFDGITLTAPGFYGAQGRQLRMGLQIPALNEMYTDFRYKGRRITNFEMESSALFGFSKLLGHEATTICLVIANRFQKVALKDYHMAMKELIKYTLDRIAQL
jgi:uridine phosphorylase